MLHGSKVNQFACRGIRGKRGFGAAEKQIYRRRELQSLVIIITNSFALTYKMSSHSHIQDYHPGNKMCCILYFRHCLPNNSRLSGPLLTEFQTIWLRHNFIHQLLPLHQPLSIHILLSVFFCKNYNCKINKQ
jgi:hypothetical protein